MKRLLSILSEKWPEYILESIVIVASILVAIALENWNDDRKDRKLETSYLQAINAEFKENLEQFKLAQKMHQKSLDASRKLLIECQMTKPNPDSLARFGYSMMFAYTFNPSQSSIESLLSTSSIEIIQNLELRRLLLSWRDLLIDYQEDEIVAANNLENRIIPYVEDTYDFRTNPDPNKIEIRFMNMIRTRIVNLEKLCELKDQEYKHEYVKVLESINRIIEITQPKE